MRLKKKLAHTSKPKVIFTHPAAKCSTSPWLGFAKPQFQQINSFQQVFDNSVE